MKHSPFILTTLLLGLILSGCKKNNPETLTPKITDENVTVTATSATFTWTVDWPGKLVSVVEVSENEDMSHSQFYGSETETDNHNFSVMVTGLKANTKYYYRYLVWNKYYVDNRFTMEVNSFKMSDVPEVKTVKVKEIIGEYATVLGTVINDNNSEVIERGVCWSKSHNPTIGESHYANGSGTGDYSVDIYIDGLDYLSYYVRAYATNGIGTSYGEELSFVARATSKPVVAGYADMNDVMHDGGSIKYEIYDNGGVTVTDHGVCWSTSHTPTVSGNHVSNGEGAEWITYEGVIEGLSANTTYYVRAYATNVKGTAYGKEISFTTYPVGSSSVPTGAIDGRFTINSRGGRVWFSQGNLQYQASSNKWQFAENQWDVIGEGNESISSSYNGWIDLFGWGTSGWNCGNAYYHPWNSQGTHWNHEYDTLYGPQKGSHLTGWCVKSDWGINNAIANGGNQAGQWRTLTIKEWTYLLNDRNTLSGMRYAKAQIDTITGVILLPDDWSASYYELSNFNNSTIPYAENTLTFEQWGTLEQYGAVFLPATGYRISTDYYSGAGYYWSSSTSIVDNPFQGASYFAECFDFYDSLFELDDGDYRSRGRGVRLVHTAQ